MQRLFFYLFLLVLSFGGSVVLGQEGMEVPVMLEECSSVLCSVMQGFPEINAWIIAIFTFLGVTLRATAELVTFVGKRLNNEKTGQIGNKIESYSIYAAQVLGWFGGGTPKAVLAKQVEKKLKDERKQAS